MSKFTVRYAERQITSDIVVDRQNDYVEIL